MTLQQLKNQLSAIEPSEGTYDGIGPEEIPLLTQLLHLRDTEPWMASRAVFALSKIPDSRAVEALSHVTADPRAEVRVAAAASMTNLKPVDANKILLALLPDSDLGVRKFAVRAVSAAHDTAVHLKVRDIETRDPVPAIREAARTKLAELKLVDR
jgi:HEAT repeat protein